MTLKKNNFVFLLLLSVILYNCTPLPRFKSEDNTKLPIENGQLSETYKNHEVLESIEGTASFYADKFNGRITYSGEVYDMNGITAAHQSFPMDTIIKVTNLKKNKSIILRINDRMPTRGDRIIDLSLGAAKELDFVNDGITDVKIEVLEWGQGKK
ncbi:MAG: septal ring lytic transglycosylase RlpA family protein [Melioribacteraceae bacterium]